jgi:hypothetical protein
MKKLIFFLVQIFLFGSISYGQLLDKNLTIGTESDQIYFGLVQSIDVSKSGDIYISDWYTKNIRVFDINGNLTDTIGREGKGPGEFSKIDGSALNDSGYLYVYDPNLIRVSIFGIGSSSNALTKTLKIPKLENSTQYGSFPSGINVFNTGGNFLLKYKIPYSAGTSNLNRKQRYVLFSKNGDIIEQPLLTLPVDQRLVKDQRGAISVTSMPFGRSSLLEIGPDDHIYTAWTEELDIKVYNKEGEYIKSITDQVKKISISDADLEQEKEKKSSFNLSNFSDQIPDSHPAFDWFEVDDDGRIWVAVNTEDRDNYSLKIYNQQGKKITQTKLSKTVEIKEIRADHAYGIEKGDNGLQSVVRYQINGLSEE